jgi:hypothetical protein
VVNQESCLDVPEEHVVVLEKQDYVNPRPPKDVREDMDDIKQLLISKINT